MWVAGIHTSVGMIRRWRCVREEWLEAGMVYRSFGDKIECFRSGTRSGRENGAYRYSVKLNELKYIEICSTR